MILWSYSSKRLEKWEFVLLLVEGYCDKVKLCGVHVGLVDAATLVGPHFYFHLRDSLWRLTHGGIVRTFTFPLARYSEDFLFKEERDSPVNKRMEAPQVCQIIHSIHVHILKKFQTSPERWGVGGDFKAPAEPQRSDRCYCHWWQGMMELEYLTISLLPCVCRGLSLRAALTTRQRRRWPAWWRASPTRRGRWSGTSTPSMSSPSCAWGRPRRSSSLHQVGQKAKNLCLFTLVLKKGDD